MTTLLVIAVSGLSVGAAACHDPAPFVLPPPMVPVDSGGEFGTLHTVWATPTTLWGRARPGIAGDLVVAGTGDGKLVAFDQATGAIRWQTPLTNRSASPAVSGAVVLVRSGVAVVSVALNTVGVDVATGRQLWSYDAPLDTMLSTSPNPGTVAGTRADADDE